MLEQMAALHTLADSMLLLVIRFSIPPNGDANAVRAEL